MENRTRRPIGRMLAYGGSISTFGEQFDEVALKQTVSCRKPGKATLEERYVKSRQAKRRLRIPYVFVLMAAVSLGLVTGCGSGQSGSIARNADPGTAQNANPVELDLASYTVTNSDGTTLIHLPPGTYKVAGTISLPSNTTFEGEGNATVLQPDTSFAGSQFITNADVNKGNNNIVIRNLKIAFALPQLTGNDSGILRFENVEQLEIDDLTMVIDSPMYGIDLYGQISNATVEGCTITNTNTMSGGGIMIRNGDPLSGRATSGIVVRNNQMESASDEAVSVFGWVGMVKDIRIENNTILAQGASFGIAAYGINSLGQSGQLSGVDITGNSIDGGNVGGIGVMGGAQQVNVVQNTVRNTTQDGIFLHSGGDGLPAVGDVSVLQNTISDIGRHGIFADGVDVQVEQNTITNCTGSGVYAAAGVSIIGNVISYAKYLITAEVENDAIIHDNIFPEGGDVLYLN